MELAGQWRREWAGTAEYGKVTEGGVTRQVARAMEVLHASGPGAKVRVMRAAYHSSSGPGIPASSYMLHSSRRVISSGFNLLESPTYPTKPLEISSTPLETSREYNTDTENYKVTEPDDTEISEPSKWRATSSGNSIRMPSEESSSTDNASIIDLDSRLGHKGVHRKYSYDSENSDNYSVKRSSTRTSPLLDAPVTLSTLKYKSLLNGSNDWNHRRKSYSFEDTSPLNEVILQSNDTLAMESSTDSGICKSTEIVNDYTEDRMRSYERKQNKYDNIFDHRHSKKTPNTFYKDSKYKSYKEHDIVIEDPLENSITLQSRGKVTITVPVTIEDDNHFKNSQTSDDSDRKVKKVEFCKTELHFAAEPGKVNIIATDEKPPPTSDFRKRRSAFVPINDRFEKPITLFGEKTDFLESNKTEEYVSRGFSESFEYEENTAATKGILKNKIPKPKPYLLGENMALGDFKKSLNLNSTPNGVSLIKKQLETKKDDNTEEIFNNNTSINERTFRNSLRAPNKSPFKYESSSTEKDIPDKIKTSPDRKNNYAIRNKLNEFNISPVNKTRTRQLRESELTYFGIANNHKNDNSHNIDTSSISSVNTNSGSIQLQPHFVDEDFRSVRLVKRISNSAQNSEAESDDTPEYQNLPLKNNFAPIPTPRSRVKYKKPDEGVVILKPIVEQVNDILTVVPEPRRSRHRRQEEKNSSVRSLSEPAKKGLDYTIQRYDELRSSTKKENTKQRCKEIKRNENDKCENTLPSKTNKYQRSSTDAEDEVPLYVNINKQDGSSDYYQESHKTVGSVERRNERLTNKSDSISGAKRQNSVKKNIRVQRTEKLSTPEYPTRPRHRETVNSNKSCKDTKNTENENSLYSVKQRKSSHKPNKESDVISQKTPDSERVLTLLKTKMKNKHDTNEDGGHTITPVTNKRKDLRKATVPTVKEHGIIAKEIIPNEKIGEKQHIGTNDRKTGRRSEYVIKYDDKNGTVSSISKVRGVHSVSRQRHVSKERNKGQHTKESKRNDKVTEKSGLRNAAP